MPQPSAQAPAPAAEAKDALASQDLTLVEFCMRLSATDRRVEMIAGFERSENAAGRVKDSEPAFAARFVAFTTQPA